MSGLSDGNDSTGILPSDVAFDITAKNANVMVDEMNSLDLAAFVNIIMSHNWPKQKKNIGAKELYAKLALTMGSHRHRQARKIYEKITRYSKRRRGMRNGKNRGTINVLELINFPQNAFRRKFNIFLEN